MPGLTAMQDDHNHLNQFYRYDQGYEGKYEEQQQQDQQQLQLQSQSQLEDQQQNGGYRYFTKEYPTLQEQPLLAKSTQGSSAEVSKTLHHEEGEEDDLLAFLQETQFIPHDAVNDQIFPAPGGFNSVPSHPCSSSSSSYSSSFADPYYSASSLNHQFVGSDPMSVSAKGKKLLSSSYSSSSSVLSSSSSSSSSSNNKRKRDDGERTVNLTSRQVFLKFVKRHKVIKNGEEEEEEVVDTSGILSRECYELWLKTRRKSPSKPEESFRKTVVSFITISDKASLPFPEEVETSLLKHLRRQVVWPCFNGRRFKHSGKRIYIGAKGLRAVGYWERKRGIVEPASPTPAPISKRTFSEEFSGYSSDEDYVAEYQHHGKKRNRRR